MKRPARFHPLAKREFTEAAEYFERESIGLGAAFIAAVERCVAEIIEYPEADLPQRRIRTRCSSTIHNDSASECVFSKEIRRRVSATIVSMS